MGRSARPLCNQAQGGQEASCDLESLRLSRRHGRLQERNLPNCPDQGRFRRRRLRFRAHRASLSRPADEGMVPQRTAGVPGNLGSRCADGAELLSLSRRSRYEPGGNVRARVGSQHRDPGFGCRSAHQSVGCARSMGRLANLDGHLTLVPEDERPNYVRPEFLRKAAALDPVDWLPKIQAKKFRLQQLIFETDTPKAAKEKLRAAVPAGTTVILYKALPEFNAAFPNSTNLEWMERELRSLPEPAASGTAAPQQH